jgi:hypothetical protein
MKRPRGQFPPRIGFFLIVAFKMRSSFFFCRESLPALNALEASVYTVGYSFSSYRLSTVDAGQSPDVITSRVCPPGSVPQHAVSSGSASHYPLLELRLSASFVQTK